MTTTKTRTLDEVLSDYRFALLTTADLTARPLTVQEVDGNVVRFLVDAEASWTADADGKTVLLGLADPKGNSFASVTGTAALNQDRATIDRLYSAAADAFFSSKDDPRIRVLEVTASAGEWWDGPSGRLGEVLAIVTRDGSKAGDSGTIELP